MGMSVQEIFDAKFKEIQSRLPIRINNPNDALSFQEVLNGVSTGTDSSNYNQNLIAKNKWTEQIQAAVQSSAQKYNVSPALIMSIIKAESGFNPNAVSSAGAQGLMQLMPATARGLGVTDSFNIQQNIDGGTRYIKEKLNQFGNDPKLALAAYNAGPGSVIKYNGIPPYPETQNYVKTVIGYYNSFSGK